MELLNKKEMILPTMNSEELVREIMKDYPMVMRKAIYEMQKLRRPALKSRDKYVQRFYDYTTKSNNNWIIMCDYYVKDPSFVVCVHFVDKWGFQAMMVNFNAESITHYSVHFLERYNERFLLQPELSKLKLLKSFLSKNATAYAKLLPDSEKYRNPFFVRFREGIGLGFVEMIERINIYHFKTFLAKDMIFENQQESFNHTSEWYKQYWDEVYKKRNLEAFDQ